MKMKNFFSAIFARAGACGKRKLAPKDSRPTRAPNTKIVNDWQEEPEAASPPGVHLEEPDFVVATRRCTLSGAWRALGAESRHSLAYAYPQLLPAAARNSILLLLHSCCGFARLAGVLVASRFSNLSSW